MLLWTRKNWLYYRREALPKLDDPLFAIWDVENFMVMTWLVNSMVEGISCNYMC